MPRGISRYDEAQYQRRLWAPSNKIGQNLALWLDAADQATIQADTSGLVSTWLDKSGNARSATQVTANLRPTFRPAVGMNGRQSVYFPATRYMIGKVALTGTVNHIYLVTTMNTAAESNARLFGAGLSGAFDYNNVGYYELQRNAATAVFQYQRNLINSNSATIVLDKPYIVEGISDGTNLWIAVNGVDSAKTAQTGSFATTDYHICHHLGGAETYTGYINEIIIDTAPYVLERRRRIRGYLAWKWGITLAVGDPYLNRPPLIGG